MPMVTSGEPAPDEVASEKLQQRQIPADEVQVQKKQPDQEANTPSPVPEKPPQVPDAAAPTMQPDQEGSTSSRVSEPASQAVEATGAAALQSGQEGSTPSIMREKVTEDGYNWRKYGQKLVKGNEFIRSYYKCTHPNCQVKKQLERSHDGQIKDITYFGQHDHPKPQLTVPVAVGFAVSIVDERPNEASLNNADKSFVELGQTPHQIEPVYAPVPLKVAASDDVKSTLSETNRMRDVADEDDDRDSKRKKKEKCNIDAASVDKQTGEPRLVVQTLSEVDIVNDGYRWRKYGQKFVKGNRNPRSYYRCSNPGCPVKKHVERASHDPKVVLTTYEGQHDHDMPPSRTVTHNTPGQGVHLTTHNDETGMKSEESTGVSLDTVVRASSGPAFDSTEKINGESKTKSEVSSIVGFEMAVHASLDPGEKSNEQLNGKPNAEMRTKLEASDPPCLEVVVHENQGLEETNIINDRQTPSADPVQS